MRDQNTRDAMHFARMEAAFGKKEPLEMPTIGETINEGLKDRRVLMVAQDEACADVVAQVLTAQGVTVQRVTTDERGLQSGKLVDTDGAPSLPTGVVVLADIDTWRLSLETRRLSRTADAIETMVRATQIGTTDDHLLIISREEALRDVTRVLNILTDRMVEADLVDQVGGVSKLPPMLRRFMTWLPRESASEMIDHLGSGPGVGKSAVVGLRTAIVAAGDAGLQIARQMAMLDTGARIIVARDPHASDVTGQPQIETLDSEMPLKLIDNPDFDALDMSMRGLNGDFDRLHLDDDHLERLFGEEAIARERQARMTIVCRDERVSLRDIAFERIDLPAGGFDHRAANEQFNQRRSSRGSRNDRRINRGGKGRR